MSIEEEIGRLLKKRKSTVATAESCTGGLISHLITNVSGSSDYFERGFVTYSISAKEESLGVAKNTIESFGVVSSQVAVEMAKKVREKSKTDYGIGVTGIAGPTGGTNEKPVGLVYIALAWKKGVKCKEFRFKGKRIEIKEKAANSALEMLRRHLNYEKL